MGNNKKKSNNKTQIVKPKPIPPQTQIVKSEPIPTEQKKKIHEEPINEPTRQFSNVRTESPDGEKLKEGEERGRHKTERNQDIYEEEVLELEGNNLFVGCECLEEVLDSIEEFQEYLIDLINDGYNLIQPVEDDNDLLLVQLDDMEDDDYSEDSEEEEIFVRRRKRN